MNGIGEKDVKFPKSQSRVGGEEKGVAAIGM